MLGSSLGEAPKAKLTVLGLVIRVVNIEVGHLAVGIALLHGNVAAKRIQHAVCTLGLRRAAEGQLKGVLSALGMVVVGGQGSAPAR